MITYTKFSPKRENLLGEIKENLEGPESEAKGILGHCPTRWTVRTSCFQRILDNYAALLQEWTISLDEKLSSNSYASFVLSKLPACIHTLSMNQFFIMIYKNGERMRDFLGLFVFIVV